MDTNKASFKFDPKDIKNHLTKMLKILASILLFLVLNNGSRSCKGINNVLASFPPTHQAPAMAPLAPNFAPTEAPTVASPPTASFPPIQAPTVAPPLKAPVPPPSPPPPLPPDEDVKAVNALLDLVWMPGSVLTPKFESSDCQTYKLPGIWCNCRLGNNICRVNRIYLRGQNLRGSIPEEIGWLAGLTFLDLSSNKLRGPIKESLVNLSQLSVLKLNKNNFEGPIPWFFAVMKSLQILDLSDNSFYGSIPWELGNLTSLKYLYLSNNLLNESIPPDLGNISSLRVLDLHDNNLSDQIPPELGNLKNLQDVDLSNNNLNGSLQSFQKLRNLQNINIRGNNFGGTIPEFISNWTFLGKLVLSGNNFTGPPLPTTITALKYLTYIFITDISGGETNFSFPEVNNSVLLRTLILRSCSLTGPIPPFIWNLRYLSHLDLSFNNLFGGIPIDVNPDFNPKSIFLRRNKLNETLPGWLTNLNGSNVDVSENFFTNVTIPAKISSKLNLFACCNTSHQHTLKWMEPNYVCGNDDSTYDHLYINCGGDATPINERNYEADLQSDGASTFFRSPNNAWAYSSMGTFLDPNQKTYILNETCNITMADAPLYRDARISPVSLKYYGFCLKNGEYTLKLHFAEIGWAESKVASIRRRRVFDIDIQGGQHYIKNFNIEEEARGVDLDTTKPFEINVSDNRLEIHLYWSGKGSTPTRNYGPLISAFSLAPVLKEPQKLPPAAIVAIAGSATIFVVLLLSLFWKLGWLHNKDNEFRAFELFPGGILSFEQIKEATKNFDSQYMIGEGGIGKVYRAKLPNGTQLAVKRISESRRGTEKFLKEIITIYDLKHPNLVGLKGCCAKQNELLLVHEYMEKGSLQNILFGREVDKSSLTWLIRVQICRDVAKGLVFLHGKESKRQIIHSDIKPTNILLDKDFNAKISDFGYAEFNAEENARKIEKIKGTSGYRAPECAVNGGNLTIKADVYSFGIVMLEIVSGKSVATYKPRDSVYLLDEAYTYQKEGGENLIALLDSVLIGSDYTEDEVLKVLNLAMKCVYPSATLRPSMSEVAEALEEVLKAVESKIKLKNRSRSNVASAVESATIISSPVAASSQSTQSGSTSREGAVSGSISKEIDDSTSSA